MCVCVFVCVRLCVCIHTHEYLCVYMDIQTNMCPFFSVLMFMFKLCIHAAFIVMPKCYLISLTDSDGISGTRNLSNSASDGIFWNLITGCTALISDGTFNQKGNQKVIHSWDSLQSQRSHNTTCCKGLLASSPYVAIKRNWLLSSQHPLPFSKIQIAQLSVEAQCGVGCS